MGRAGDVMGTARGVMGMVKDMMGTVRDKMGTVGAGWIYAPWEDLWEVQGVDL